MELVAVLALDIPVRAAEPDVSDLQAPVAAFLVGAELLPSLGRHDLEASALEHMSAVTRAKAGVLPVDEESRRILRTG